MIFFIILSQFPYIIYAQYRLSAGGHVLKVSKSNPWKKSLSDYQSLVFIKCKDYFAPAEYEQFPYIHQKYALFGQRKEPNDNRFYKLSYSRKDQEFKLVRNPESISAFFEGNMQKRKTEISHSLEYQNEWFCERGLIDLKILGSRNKKNTEWLNKQLRTYGVYGEGNAPSSCWYPYIAPGADRSVEIRQYVDKNKSGRHGLCHEDSDPNKKGKKICEITFHTTTGIMYTVYKGEDDRQCSEFLESDNSYVEEIHHGDEDTIEEKTTAEIKEVIEIGGNVYKLFNGYYYLLQYPVFFNSAENFTDMTLVNFLSNKSIAVAPIAPSTRNPKNTYFFYRHPDTLLTFLLAKTQSNKMRIYSVLKTPSKIAYQATLLDNRYQLSNDTEKLKYEHRVDLVGSIYSQVNNFISKHNGYFDKVDNSVINNRIIKVDDGNNNLLSNEQKKEINSVNNGFDKVLRQIALFRIRAAEWEKKAKNDYSDFITINGTILKKRDKGKFIKIDDQHFYRLANRNGSIGFPAQILDGSVLFTREGSAYKRSEYKLKTSSIKAPIEKSFELKKAETQVWGYIVEYLQIPVIQEGNQPKHYIFFFKENTIIYPNRTVAKNLKEAFRSIYGSSNVKHYKEWQYVLLIDDHQAFKKNKVYKEFKSNSVYVNKLINNNSTAKTLEIYLVRENEAIRTSKNTNFIGDAKGKEVSNPIQALSSLELAKGGGKRPIELHFFMEEGLSFSANDEINYRGAPKIIANLAKKNVKRIVFWEFRNRKEIDHNNEYGYFKFWKKDIIQNILKKNKIKLRHVFVLPKDQLSEDLESENDWFLYSQIDQVNVPFKLTKQLILME